jgi:hypothetical protein
MKDHLQNSAVIVKGGQSLKTRRSILMIIEGGACFLLAVSASAFLEITPRSCIQIWIRVIQQVA